MADRIYLLGPDNKLISMKEEPYYKEDLLQTLLADHPDLLAGEQIDSDEPRRWLLVTREMAVPGEQGGASRWSLDHLFLDQDAVPTLVEVKRSSDTRIRREVMGQMLDYAANAVVYWPVEEIQAKFEARCEREGVGPNTELVNLLGADHDADGFWKQVKTNLQAGRIRMVFIADEIPSELRRIVEFLNGQMDPAEVLAVEIKQFVGEGVKTLVPRVIGQTEAARQKKASASFVRESISEEEFLTEFDSKRSSTEQDIARKLISWAKEKGLRDDFRRGSRGVAFIPGVQCGSNSVWPVSLRSHQGQLVIRV
jgi:hypothetical protein